MHHIRSHLQMYSTTISQNNVLLEHIIYHDLVFTERHLLNGSRYWFGFFPEGPLQTKLWFFDRLCCLKTCLLHWKLQNCFLSLY